MDPEEARKLRQQANIDYLKNRIDKEAYKKILSELPPATRKQWLTACLNLSLILGLLGGCVYYVSQSKRAPYHGCWNNYTKSYYVPSFGQQCGYGKQTD